MLKIKPSLFHKNDFLFWGLGLGYPFTYSGSLVLSLNNLNLYLKEELLNKICYYIFLLSTNKSITIIHSFISTVPYRDL